MDRFERRPHHEALVGLLRGAMHRNHDLVEAVINQQFYVPLGENFAVRDHTHIGYAALLGEPYYFRKILIKRRLCSASNDDHERTRKNQRRDARDLLFGKDALVSAHVLVVAEIAHRTAQIAGHYRIKPDDEMAQTTRMSERHTRKFKARIADNTVQFEQPVYSAHGVTLTIF